LLKRAMEQIDAPNEAIRRALSELDSSKDPGNDD